MNLIWNEAKNEMLKKSRKLSFDMVELAIARGQFVRIVNHPKEKYKHQKMMMLDIDGYSHCIPFVIDKEGRFFLKTIYKSRKLKKQMQKGKLNEKGEP